MNFSPRFFRFAAICAWVTVITTLAVHVLPNLWGNATTFEQQIQLRLNGIYMAQRWAVIVHCVLVPLSMFALGLAKLREAPALVGFGFLGFLFFGATEILRTSLSIFAMNRAWRTGYAAALDEPTREAFRSVIVAYPGINDALFFIFYVCFLLGLVCYGFAFLRSEGRASHIGLLFILWSLLNVPTLIDTIKGTEWLGSYFQWVGPYFQPLARLYVGIWLWKNAVTIAKNISNAACTTESRGCH